MSLNHFSSNYSSFQKWDLYPEKSCVESWVENFRKIKFLFFYHNSILNGQILVVGCLYNCSYKKNYQSEFCLKNWKWTIQKMCLLIIEFVCTHSEQFLFLSLSFSLKQNIFSFDFLLWWNEFVLINDVCNMFLVVFIFGLTNVFVCGDFAERLLEQHNELRATHNTPPLKLDDDLTKKANDIVRKAAKDGDFFQGKDSPPGVNTMMVCASFKRKEDSAKDVASSWFVHTTSSRPSYRLDIICQLLDFFIASLTFSKEGFVTTNRLNDCTCISNVFLSTIVPIYKLKSWLSIMIHSFRYDEVCSDDFSFDNANTLSKATAFTQMIWKDTNTLGVAKATSKDGAESCSFIAAVYRPAGSVCFHFWDFA